MSELKMLATASSIGIAMVLSVFFGLGAGYWLDGRLGTRPVFILLGLLCGLAAAFNNLIVLSRRLERQRKGFYGHDGKGGAGDGEDGQGAGRDGSGAGKGGAPADKGSPGGYAGPGGSGG
ncbi:MAG: AtpZ/AtpI family protein [Deltaproteobacteria bacterium]|nr:AtpZ/AtpI family protein [Deltaproteobacteria bacterium]